MSDFKKIIIVKGKKYLIQPSTRDYKKYDVYYVFNAQEWGGGLKKNEFVKKYLLSFGDKRYEHYKDKFKYYKDLDHKDKKRRELYRLRHRNDNIDNPEYPGFWSWNYLW